MQTTMNRTGGYGGIGDEPCLISGRRRIENEKVQYLSDSGLPYTTVCPNFSVRSVYTIRRRVEAAVKFLAFSSFDPLFKKSQNWFITVFRYGPLLPGPP